MNLKIKLLIVGFLLVCNGAYAVDAVPRPSRQPRWDTEVAWFLYGAETLYNKTFSDVTLSGTVTFSPTQMITVSDGDSVRLSGTDLYPIYAAIDGVQKFKVDSLGNTTIAGTVKMADDKALTLGTTLTNAETNIKLLFDETTTGIGMFRLGDMSNPQILKVNPGATVAGSEIYINHALGAGNCDDLLGSYSKVTVTGSGDAGLTLVGDASRAYVGATGGANNSVASQAYGTQAWAKHGGTGAVTAMSGLSAMMDVGAENFTASTINSGHFHIQGAANVTGQFDGVMVEVYPDVTSMDNALAIAIDNGAVVQYGINFSGAFAGAEMKLRNGATIANASATALTITEDNINLVGNVGLNGLTWVGVKATSYASSASQVWFSAGMDTIFARGATGNAFFAKLSDLSSAH